MLYIVTYRNRKSSNATNELVVYGSEDLFSICWMFSNLEDIIEYKVAYSGGNVDHRVFGWGKMEKWVSKFNWN